MNDFQGIPSLGGVESVNGDPGPAVVLDAADVGAPTVADLAANARKLGAADVVETLADLDLIAPSVGGARTITGVVILTDQIVLPPGDYIVAGPLSVIAGISSAQCGFTGDVDGPLLVGEIVASQIALTNSSVGASAQAMHVQSASRVCRIEYCAIVGGAKAGTVGPIGNIVTLDRLLMTGCAGGLVWSGTVVISEATRCASAQLPPGSVTFSIPDGTIIARAISFEASSFVTTNTADRGIRVGSGVILAAASPLVSVQITGSKITSLTGAPAGLGRVWDEGAGTLSRKDPRVQLRGNIGEPDSLILGDVDFADAVTPIISAYVGPAPTAWVPIAHQNAGPTSVLTLLTVSARFTLFRNGGDPADWYLEYTGPNRATVEVTFAVTAAATSGGGAGEVIEYRAEFKRAADPWTAIANSNRSLEQRTAYATITGSSFFSIETGDRFRLSRRNTTGTATTKISFYDLVVVG